MSSDGVDTSPGTTTAVEGRANVTAASAPAISAMTTGSGAEANDGDGRAISRDRLRAVPEHQDPLRSGPVGDDAGDRRGERGRHEQPERGEPGRRRSATVVGLDEHSDPQRPLGDVEGQRGEDRQQEPAVADRSSDRGDRHRPRSQ